MSTAAPEHPDVTTKRRADALAEMQKLNQDHMLLTDDLTAARRTIAQLEDRVDLLSGEYKQAKIEKAVYQRKLIELASAMSNIGLLTGKAQEIMMTVGDLLDEETEQAAKDEQESAAAIVASLPPAQTPVAQRAPPEPVAGVTVPRSVVDQVRADLGHE